MKRRRAININDHPVLYKPYLRRLDLAMPNSGSSKPLRNRVLQNDGMSPTVRLRRSVDALPSFHSKCESRKKEEKHEQQNNISFTSISVRDSKNSILNFSSSLFNLSLNPMDKELSSPFPNFSFVKRKGFLAARCASTIERFTLGPTALDAAGHPSQSSADNASRLCARRYVFPRDHVTANRLSIGSYGS